MASPPGDARRRGRRGGGSRTRVRVPPGADPHGPTRAAVQHGGPARPRASLELRRDGRQGRWLPDRPVPAARGLRARPARGLRVIPAPQSDRAASGPLRVPAGGDHARRRRARAPRRAAPDDRPARVLPLLGARRGALLQPPGELLPHLRPPLPAVARGAGAVRRGRGGGTAPSRAQRPRGIAAGGGGRDGHRPAGRVARLVAATADARPTWRASATRRPSPAACSSRSRRTRSSSPTATTTPSRSGTCSRWKACAATSPWSTCRSRTRDGGSRSCVAAIPLRAPARDRDGAGTAGGRVGRHHRDGAGGARRRSASRPACSSHDRRP